MCRARTLSCRSWGGWLQCMCFQSRIPESLRIRPCRSIFSCLTANLPVFCICFLRSIVLFHCMHFLFVRMSGFGRCMKDWLYNQSPGSRRLRRSRCLLRRCISLLSAMHCCIQFRCLKDCILLCRRMNLFRMKFLLGNFRLFDCYSCHLCCCRVPEEAEGMSRILRSSYMWCN